MQGPKGKSAEWQDAWRTHFTPSTLLLHSPSINLTIRKLSRDSPRLATLRGVPWNWEDRVALRYMCNTSSLTFRVAIMRCKWAEFECTVRWLTLHTQQHVCNDFLFCLNQPLLSFDWSIHFSSCGTYACKFIMSTDGLSMSSHALAAPSACAVHSCARIVRKSLVGFSRRAEMLILWCHGIEFPNSVEAMQPFQVFPWSSSSI